MNHRIVAAAAAILLPVAPLGCGGPDPGNRSPLASSDPTAAQRARAQAAEAEQDARAAEAAAVGDALRGIERP